MVERLYGFHIACNDPDNGLPDDKAHALQLDFGHSDYLELGMCGGREPMFRLLSPAPCFRLGRAVYSFARSKDWIGNWCWNVYWLRPLDAAKLVRDLMCDERWACEAGPSDAYDTFNSKDVHAFMSVWSRSLFPPELVPITASADDGLIQPQSTKEI